MDILKIPYQCKKVNQFYQNIDFVKQQTHRLELNAKKFLQEMKQYRSFYGSVRLNWE